MKKIKSLSLLAVILVLISACDNDFDEINTSPIAITSLDPALILNSAVINSSYPTGTLNYEEGIVQQIISSNTGLLVGANFNQVNINNTPAVWINYYQNVIRYTNDVISRTKDNAARSNLTNMAKIVQANAFMILTDTYGAIPYTDAGKGYSNQIFYPTYQSQSEVYIAIISTLTEASAGLSAAGTVEASDVLYSGNIEKWKKFGYSLLLRAGMRLSKVDPTAAAAAVSAAFAGGVITSNADNAVVKHDGNFTSPIGNIMNSTEAANYYLAKPFVDALKSNNDPRLSAIAIRAVGATSGPGQTPAVSTKVGADQYGMPMGSTDGDADVAGAALPGGGSRYAFSQVDRNRLVKRTSPMYLITAGQTNLLLSEARFRGWVNSGDVETYYSNGIKAHMDQMVTYDANSAVAAGDRDTYASNMVATLAGNELQHINYEYWVASFLSGPEAWANYRRSGFPVLAANPFPGRTVEFITRLTYPPSEFAVNQVNVAAAVVTNGATEDVLNTKVWWDK